MGIVYYAIVILGVVAQVCSNDDCGHLGNCDYLVMTSIFQTGVCGRAARCFWELMEVKRCLEGETQFMVEYKLKINMALCGMTNYSTHKCTTPPDKKLFNIFDEGTQHPNLSLFDFYPVPTHYIREDNDGKEEIIEYIQRCKMLEVECNRLMDKTIDALCNIAITPENIKQLEAKMNAKLRDKNFYQLTMHNGKLNTSDHNKCNVKILTRRKKEKNTKEYKDQYVYDEIYPRLRPPYFDLYILYAIDPNKKLKNLRLEERWWNETKAFQSLPHYLPEEMVIAIHNAIKHVYDSKTAELGASRLKKLGFEWKPEKFCWSSSTIVCVDKSKLGEFQAKCHLTEADLLKWNPCTTVKQKEAMQNGNITSPTTPAPDPEETTEQGGTTEPGVTPGNGNK